MQLPHTVNPPPETDDPTLPAGYGAAALRYARRVAVFVLGISVLLVGIVMIVGPGPAVVVIPLGLGILATEFLWARRILDSLKRRIAAGQALLPDSPAFRWTRIFRPKKSGD
jgi:uncharacterized protein (TIGR02611 family)